MNRSKTIAMCRKHGIMLLDCGNCIRADAPVGYVLATTYCHSSDAYIERGVVSKTQAWKGIYDDIEKGIIKCEETDCDACTENLNFDDIHRLYGGDRLA